MRPVVTLVVKGRGNVRPVVTLVVKGRGNVSARGRGLAAAVGPDYGAEAEGEGEDGGGRVVVEVRVCQQ